jgi:hypothetical protein
MGMSRHEKEVRELLKEHCTYDRLSTGHEIWNLPVSGIFPVKARGRGKEIHSRTWNNALAQLKRTLRKQGVALT